jgi:hypothetical protein
MCVIKMQAYGNFNVRVQQNNFGKSKFRCSAVSQRAHEGHKALNGTRPRSPFAVVFITLLLPLNFFFSSSFAGLSAGFFIP